MPPLRRTVHLFQWRREGVKAGEGRTPVKMGERPKMFAPSDVHYFFREIFYLLPKFSDQLLTEDHFFSLSILAFRFPGGFLANFFPKTGENDPKWEKMISTFGRKAQNGRKHTLKWEKIQLKF